MKIMKKTISMLLCCAMLGALCACQHGGDYEKRTYVPQFDMTVSYGFEDEELKSDDGTTYYRQSLGTATVSSKDERAAERINSSLAGAVCQIRGRRGVHQARCRGSARRRADRAELLLCAERYALRYARFERRVRRFAGYRRHPRRFYANPAAATMPITARF